MFLVKPYNPILGEVFKCHWLNEDGSKTTYISEQVSHHPPISAFHTYNPYLNITFEGWCEPKTQLSLNSASSFPNGNFRIILHETGEIYYISKFPSLTVYNILFGQIEIDIAGEFELTCQKNSTTSNINITKGGNYEGYINVDKKKKLMQVKGSFEKGTKFNYLKKKNQKI